MFEYLHQLTLAYPVVVVLLPAPLALVGAVLLNKVLW